MQSPVVHVYMALTFGAFIFLGLALWTSIEHSVSGSWWFIPFRFRPEAGQIRRKRRFLWLPKTIGGIRRFWEKAEIVQIYSAAGTMTGYDWCPAEWKDIAWGEFAEDIQTEMKGGIFGNVRGDIHVKKRENALVVFDEKRIR